MPGALSRRCATPSERDRLLGAAAQLGGYRDPESHAFIESWFGKPKEGGIWLHEFETLDEAGR